MIDPGVETHLELMREADRVSVRAYVAAAPARPLRWRLETVARSGGGTSRVAQSGMVQGPAEKPVSVTSVSLHSQGSVVLTVFDGTREVAREETLLEPTTALSDEGY